MPAVAVWTTAWWQCSVQAEGDGLVICFSTCGCIVTMTLPTPHPPVLSALLSAATFCGCVNCEKGRLASARLSRSMSQARMSSSRSGSDAAICRGAQRVCGTWGCLSGTRGEVGEA